MHPFTAVLRAHGGVARASEIARGQSNQRALRRAHARGELIRPRRGVYALPEVAPDIRRAAAVGGRVAGVSALRHHGLWVPPDASPEFHVEVVDEVVAQSAKVRGSDVLVHWLTAGSAPRFGVAPLEATLRRAANDLTLPFAVAVLDSALRATPLTPVELQFLAAGWRPKARAAAALADERSESGTESVLRVLLHEAGIPSTPQVRLPLGGLERADLLVGDRLLIECDSEAHHSGPANRRADLRRDELLMALGFVVFRTDYSQVFGDPAGVVATVAAIVARGDHLSARPGA